ncbi:MAG: NAD(P)H-dependent oxidoreductase subunit E, partial [Elainellaceae cyanobacterium]
MDLNDLRQLATLPTTPYKIRCCTVGGCLAANGLAVKTQLDAAVGDAGLTEHVTVCSVGCLGLCSQGPLVQVDPTGDLYCRVDPEQAPQILAAVSPNAVAPNAVSPAIASPPAAMSLSPNLPFFTRQQRIVLENSGHIDPKRIEDYVAAQGYAALY